MKLIKLTIALGLIFTITSVSIKISNENLGQLKSLVQQTKNSTATDSTISTQNITLNATTTSDSIEAEIYDPAQPLNTSGSDNPPKPLMNKTIVNKIGNKIDLLAHDPASSEITGVGIIKDSPPKSIEFEPVVYVNEISPAAKLAIQLEESGDIELQKILNSGFETPKTITSVISDKVTRVDKPANLNFFNSAVDPKQEGFWSNVEYNRYNNRLLDTHRYYTPARFEKNMFGDVIVHAPSDSKMQITTPAAMTVISESSSFLSR